MHNAMEPSALASRLRLLVVTGALAVSVGTQPALSAAEPRLHTNETYVEEGSETTSLSINDPIAVFAFVFGALPKQVKVYPTENYYYFSFIHDGEPYSGNIRLDAVDRDQGKVHFAYFQAPSEWKSEGRDTYIALDASYGIDVERREPFIYRISYKTKSVLFALNDLSNVRPPSTAIAPHENSLGPIFDESGIRFFLIFNSQLKIFHYILDETEKVPDKFFATARTDRIVVGRRTGFAFYRDHRLERKILIGAFDGNSRLNNYFDGPFDQLPDNFIEGESLRDAIVAADPSVTGKIGRLGHFADGESRYSIHPYVLYRKEGDLHRFHACATHKEKHPAYYRCFLDSVNRN